MGLKNIWGDVLVLLFALAVGMSWQVRGGGGGRDLPDHGKLYKLNRMHLPNVAVTLFITFCLTVDI